MIIEKYYDSLPGMLEFFDKKGGRDCFKGNTVSDFEIWKKQAVNTLKELTGLESLIDCYKERQVSGTDTDLAGACASTTTLYGEVRTETDRWEETEVTETEEGILRRKVNFRVDDNTIMPMYILEPKEAGIPEIGKKLKVAKTDFKKAPKGIYMALAGHQGAGKYSVAGVKDIPVVKEKIRYFNYDYGLQLARKGYIAICPDPRGFGERRDISFQGDEDERFVSGSCRAVSHMALPLGLTAIGLCCYDYITLLDYIQSENIYDISDLGVIGFSGGGMQALYLSAMEERIKKVVISGYMYGFKDSLLLLNGNCDCNYIPNLWKHFDMGDIGGLIAPRPLMIQSCRDDHLNGYRGMENVNEQVEKIRKIYGLYNADESLLHDVREGRHHFHSGVLEKLM